MKISIPGLGGRLQRARKDARISQTGVAEMIGVSWMTVHRWERSQRMILDATLDRLCEIYNRPLRWFLTLEEGDLEPVTGPSAGPRAATQISQKIAAASVQDLPMIENVVDDLLAGLRRMD